MADRASSYTEIVGEVGALIERHVENDPTVTAYMVARAALLEVRGIRGAGRAGELAYALADELAGEMA